MDNVFFVPGANPPFPGYEEWLEEVRRAPIWQAKAPRPYVPDMRDGLGKDKFPPPPPRSNSEPRPSSNYDRDAVLAAINSVWQNRPDLFWESLWFTQYLQDDPDEGLRYTRDRKYDTGFSDAITYELRSRLPGIDSYSLIKLGHQFQAQVTAVFESLPLSIRRAPWVGPDGRMPE